MKENYRLLESEYIEELRGTGELYEHVRTGAKVFTIRNSDRNKVFMIGFRTTPHNSTGVAHIMEHSVLCGSAKYPMKDPFVELAKGSLNTFLNAMTFPDKTVYPVASVNDRDFMNLMDVYLDSVFHPNVYREQKIFRQEGWHYELDDPNGENEELRVNGVVYNEMKGVFSSPDSVLEHYTFRSLFPDTIYANESGGLPEKIPELSYDEFLAFHKKYYHPSNSYIYLYGDMDMEEKLDWIDENYLKFYDRITVDSVVAPQPAYAEKKCDREFYAVGADEDEKEKAFLSENYVILDEPDQESSIAWQILDFILLSSPGAVLREALVKAGICEDVEGGYNGEILQPYFSVVARNTEEERQEEFHRIVRDTLTDLIEKGISKKSLKAALNFIEFKYREEDYGTMPAGLTIGLNILSSWLYDKSPYVYLYYNETFRKLKELIETDYFEELIRRNILNNDFCASVNILPKKGLTEEQDEEQKKKLDALRLSMTAEEKEQLSLETLALKAYQQEPDSPEALKTLPVLEISDIDRNAEKINVGLEDGIIFSEADTRKIAYMRVMFDTENFTEEEIRYASFMKDIFGEMNTKQHDYSDLFDEILLSTGGISFKLDSFPFRENPGAETGYRGLMAAEIRVLEDHIPEGLKLTLEMMMDTVFTDPVRMAELLNEAKIQQRSVLDGALHRAAVARCSSYFSETQRYHDIAAGIGYYDFIDEAVKNCRDAEKMQEFMERLNQVRERLFTQKRVSFALYGSRAAEKAMAAELSGFKKALYSEEREQTGSGAKPACIGRKNEGFKMSSQVNYVARCGSFGSHGLKYDGGLQVLRMMLSYEYLWTKLRVLGGAYGCMAAFTTGGSASLVSYRDPAVAATNRVYEELPAYLDSWKGDADSVRKYIIGAIAVMDMPITDSIQAANQVVYYLYKLTNEERQKERDEILTCTPEKIRSFAAYIRAILSDHAVCTIGGAAAVEKDRDLFESVRDLY